MSVHNVKGGRSAAKKWPSVAEIAVLDRDGLAALWPVLMGGMVPRSMSQGLMRRFLAFEVQARTHGGLGRTEIERLERIAEGRARAGSTKMAAGTRFLREWNGVTHVVERTEAGYRWNGRIFASLSAIAKEITGAHWSGPRFFGVTAGVKSAGSKSRVARPARKGATA